MRTLPLPDGTEALVDDEDYERCRIYKWQIDYVANRVFAWQNPHKNCRILLGRFLTSTFSDEEVVRNINGDIRDCRKQNLVVIDRCDLPLEKRHTFRPWGGEKYKGVCYDKAYNRYTCDFRQNKKRVFRGVFDTAEDAARAYDYVASLHAPEGAYLNFPNETPSAEALARRRTLKRAKGEGIHPKA